MFNSKIRFISLPGLLNHIQEYWQTYTKETRLPAIFVWIVVLICVAPFLLNQLGVDFSTRIITTDLSQISQATPAQLNDTLHFLLRGSFTHTILEWSAFCTAIFTAILAFVYFRIEGDVTTPVIAVALLCAGIMDAFHTLAADRLINAVADNHNLIPFTWALCRLGNALLTVIGVGIFLAIDPKKWYKNSFFIAAVSIFFGTLAYSIIHTCAVSNSLPETMFPNSWITRPWDIAPLVIYLLAGFFVFPSFYLKYPSLFSYALIISTIPNAITQLHMAFGSADLFDNHFNIAHFLKIIAYLVPLAGLIFDYAHTNQKMQTANRQLYQTINDQEKTEFALRQSEVLLKDRNQELAVTLQELQRTQSQLIHTEKMSSLGDLVGGIAHEINNPVNFIYGNLMHTDNYTSDLLNLIQLYQTEYPQPTEAITAEIEAVDLEFIRDDLPKMLASMKSGADRIRAIVLSLRNFARLDEAELKQVNLHDGIDGALMILNHRLAQGITVIKNYGDLPQIECYPSQLNQAWLILTENAIDALNESNSPLPQLTITSNLIDEHWIQVAIADNGKGIPEDIQSKIFDPFFTTKPVGKGTGLGLSVCYQVVKKHGGLIMISSQPQQGTTVTVTLPRHTQG